MSTVFVTCFMSSSIGTISSRLNSTRYSSCVSRVSELNNKHIAANHWSSAFTRVAYVTPDHPKCVV